MAEILTIRSERVDDLPLLLAQLDRMGLQPLLDEHFPTHGNWVGLSLGWVTVVWLTHILSEADHRPAQRAPLVLDPAVSGAGGPCHRLDPAAVGGLAGPDADGVRGPPVVGRPTDGAGGVVCREPDADDSPPHDRAPAGML